MTNPDRPAGRNLDLQAPPVKRAAVRLGLEVLQPKTARDEQLHQRLGTLAPDVCVVVAYGRILPGSLLGIPARGFVNLHFSLLPAYRGAAPVQRALIDGSPETGVTVIVLTEGMDEGPILAARRVAIDPEETAGELGERLAALGAPLLVEAVRSYVAGRLDPVPQDDSLATYAPKIDASETRIGWARDAAAITNLVRGLSPAPGAWTIFRGARLRVLRATPEQGAGPPGALIDPLTPLVAAGKGAVRLVEVQPAGRRAMSGADYARGLRAVAGDRFE